MAKQYIDADMRVTVLSFDIEHEEYERIEMSISDALDFATDEGCPPKVEAIPIDFIKKIEAMGFDYMHCAGVILGLWNEERKEQDGDDQTRTTLCYPEKMS